MKRSITTFAGQRDCRVDISGYHDQYRFVGQSFDCRPDQLCIVGGEGALGDEHYRLPGEPLPPGRRI
ncbi:MAG: hypothetical protein ABWZ98_02295, partial [Nakamurella sp.]